MREGTAAPPATGAASAMRVLVVDDEPPARAKLRRLVSAAGGAVVVGEAATGAEAVEAIRELAPDLVFLDVQMPDLDGFGVIEQVGVGAMPPVVFVTAYDEHALRAFEVRALDYLLKPYPPERFAAVMAHARERVRARLEERGRERDRADAPDWAARLQELLGAVAPAAAPPRYLRRILVHQGDRAAFLPVEQLDRVEAERNTVRLHAAGGAVFQLRGGITALAGRLDPARFLRANRSTIVRLDAIREMYAWSHGDYRIVMHDGTVVTWSRRYRAGVDEEFGA